MNENNDCNLEENSIRDIEASKECLTFLLGRMFHPQVICSAPGMTCKRLSDTIRFLARSLEREENLMIKAGYPDFAAHQKEHKRLLQSLNVKKERLVCSNYDNGEILSFFADWRNHHTLTFDKPFEEFLQKRC